MVSITAPSPLLGWNSPVPLLLREGDDVGRVQKGDKPRASVIGGVEDYDEESIRKLVQG